MVQAHRSYLWNQRSRFVGRRILSSVCRLEEEVLELDCILQAQVATLDPLVVPDQKDSVGCSYWIARVA